MNQSNQTQSETTSTLLGDILHLIATTLHLEECIRPILQRVQTASHALGIYFVIFDEPEIRETWGDTRFAVDELDAFLAQLSPGIHANPHFLNSSNWFAAPLYEDGKCVGGVSVWFGDQPIPAIDNTFFQVVVDSLAIVVQNLRARENHERSRQLTLSLLNSITDPLLVLDGDRKLLIMNPAAETTFSLSTAQGRGKTLREVVQSEELVKLVEENSKVAEWVIGDNKTFIPRIVSVSDPDSHTMGWVLALRDITHFKKLNRNQTEFMRIVSHDLRSPLTSMQGFGSMLQQGLVGELNEKQEHFVTKIMAGISQMTALVDNIQDAGRYDPETGFYEMKRSPCDLHEIVKRVVDNQLVPAEKELKILVSVADDVPIINADTNMLERAIINLFDNAIKYTPSGGMVELNITRAKDEILVVVRDNGLGISSEDQKRLFDRHVRLVRQEHKKIKGSGLGLFIVRSVAQRHGGDAWVVSEEGKGSAFYLSIPLQGPNLVALKE